MLHIIYNFYKKKYQDKKEHFSESNSSESNSSIVKNISLILYLICVGLSAYISFNCNRYNGKNMALSIFFAIFAALCGPAYLFNWLVVTYLGIPCQKCAAAAITKKN